MPKEKKTLLNRLRCYVDEFGSDIFKIDSSILFCKICETKVNSDKKYNVSQHLKTDKHLKGINRCKEQTQRKQQQLMTVNISKKSSFNKDLCEALISANITLNKLSNPKFKTFLETYTKNEIACEATLRKGYVDDIYTETLNAIREKISNKMI